VYFPAILYINIDSVIAMLSDIRESNGLLVVRIRNELKIASKFFFITGRFNLERLIFFIFREVLPS